jgi:G:T-mismatch repair DNA endonuclease (very short patch repair protein)
MTYADSRKGKIVNGYKCIGHTRDQFWGQFKIDNSQEWSKQQRQEWQSENLRRNIQKAKANDERRQQSLTPEQRHEQYSQLLSELTLHPDDRADLIRRSFTDEQIESSGFKSIERYHQLKSQYSELLPGISRGNRLIIANNGYLCPIRNTEGLIVACQVRLRNLPSTEDSRYRWLSGGGQTLHLYPEGCKSEGELPLPIFLSQGEPEGIALAEGTGAKPFLVSQQLNFFTIGAAGGQWVSSPELFRSSLEKAGIEVGTKEIKIFPDAGDIINPSVMSRWQRVILQLEEWGWSVQVGWWGQIDKSHPDVDELTDLSKIEYISAEEFFELPNQKQEKSHEGCSQEQPKDDWKEKIRKEWKKNRKFTPLFTEDNEWCNFPRPCENTISLYKAGLGRGKTTQLKAWVEQWRKEIKNWVEQWKEEGAKGFICLGYRNSLLLQLCAEDKLGFYHFHEHNGELMKSAPGEGIALCVDSLWRFSPEDFDGKIIILDEFKSALKHLLKSSTIRKREKILNLFHEAIKRCRQVVCLDGLMADWCVDYLKEIAPEKVVITAENTFIGKKPEVKFLLGTSEEIIGEESGKEKKIKVNDRSPWLDIALKAKAPAICADSQVLMEALDNLFTERGYKVLRVDSKTVPEAYVKEFLKNCDAYLKKHKIDVLLYTPSAESGVDISITDYFTHHFGFFFGMIDIDGILQMVGRIRDTVTKYIWCRSFASKDEKQHFRSPYAEKIATATDEFLKSTIGNSVTGEELIAHLSAVIKSSFETPDNRVRRTIDSIDNQEKPNLREFLREALVDSGYKVTDCIHRREIAGNKVKNECKKVKRQNSADIFNAENIALELVPDLSFDARWEERCKVFKAKYRERLPGIEESQVWSEDFIYRVKYENRELISQCEMSWLFHNPEVAKRESQESLHWLARRFGRFIGDFRSRFSRIHALRELKFEFFLNPQSKWSDDSPEVVKFVKQAKKHSIALGKYQGKQSNTRFIGRILSEMFGLKQMECGKEGDKRIYCLNPEVFQDPVRVQILACVEKRLIEKPAKELDWEAARNEAYGVVPDVSEAETQQEQSQEDSTVVEPIVVEPIVVEPIVVEQVTDPSVTGRITESIAYHYESTGSTPVDELIARFIRCHDSFKDFTEISKYAPECESAAEKEELIEAAILYSPLEVKPTWQKWWESVLWEVRDFWQKLDQDEQSCLRRTN